MIPCTKKEKFDDNKCPYCKTNISKKDKKKHMKNCIYNPNIDLNKYTIYDPSSQIIGI